MSLYDYEDDVIRPLGEERAHFAQNCMVVLCPRLPRPYDRGAGNVTVTGQDVVLTPKAGLSLAMAVHELASNAAKYGALSTTSGRLVVA